MSIEDGETLRQFGVHGYAALMSIFSARPGRSMVRRMTLQCRECQVADATRARLRRMHTAYQGRNR